MKIIHFVKNSIPYYGGMDIAFDDDVADRYIAAGIATLYVAANESKVKAEIDAGARTATKVPEENSISKK